jgi:hypothetical protein
MAFWFDVLELSQAFQQNHMHRLLDQRILGFSTTPDAN